MVVLPIEYIEPLFRPPSEADALILQITLGCTWNECAFCEMYSTRKFTVRKQEEVFTEIEASAPFAEMVRKVFLADGNAMALSSRRLHPVLKKINATFPKLKRISCYAMASDFSKKTMEELVALREAGLTQCYIGIESGDDEVLRLMNKNETYDSTVKGLLRAKEAGIKLSVIILNGVGGLKYSRQHAIGSAKALNAIQPGFASVLVLSFPKGTEHYKERFGGEYQPMSIKELLEEMHVFIEHTELENTIFRSNHASNYLVLKGVLGRNKDQFLKALEAVIARPDLANLREEWMRGL